MSAVQSCSESEISGFHGGHFEECPLLGYKYPVTANVVPSSPILINLIMEALSSSETSVLTRATLRNIPEDCILHSDRRENLKSYIALTGWAL
jgi:hypothetical protein